VTYGRASSAGAVRWLGTLARGAAVLLGTVLLVLLVPSEAWAADLDEVTTGRMTIPSGTVALSGTYDHQIAVGAVSVYHSLTIAGSVDMRVYCYRESFDPDISGASASDSNNPATGYYTGTNVSQTWNGGAAGATTTNPSLVTCPVATSPTEQTVPKVIRLGTTNTGDTPRYSWYSIGVTPVSSCLTSWSGLWASADGTTIKVRFDWTGATKPVGGWRVESLDGATLYGTIPRRVMEGTLETQGVNITSAAVPTDLRIEAADDATCWAEVATGVASDDVYVDDGTNECSFGDVACYFRSALNWAFVPESSTLDQFGSMWDDMGTKIPFVYVAGGFELLSFNVAESGAGWSYDGVMRLPCAMGDSLNICETGTYTYVLPPGDAILTWMRDYREALSVFMWLLLVVPLGLFVWRRLFPVVGSGAQ